MAESTTTSDDRSGSVRQLSIGQILGVWAAAAGPMALLAWVVAPWLRDQLGGQDPFAQALLISLTAGLVWQFVLVLILTRHEIGRLRWPDVRDALWLHRPRDPKSGRVGGRVWWWALLFIFLFLAVESLPGLSGSVPRDFGELLDSERGEAFFRDAWGWWTLVVVFGVFNTFLGEELLFRGYLLPRMQGAFGRGDWVANGILFGLYHLHVPWVIPSTLIADTFLFAYPSRRFESAWMGIIIHSTQTVFISVVILGLVLS